MSGGGGLRIIAVRQSMASSNGPVPGIINPAQPADVPTHGKETKTWPQVSQISDCPEGTVRRRVPLCWSGYPKKHRATKPPRRMLHAQIDHRHDCSRLPVIAGSRSLG